MIRFVVRHAPLVMLLVLCIVGFGALSYATLPREAAPDVKIPVVMVTTPYIGVSPADVESLVTIPIENELASVKDVKKLSSTSAEGASIVSLEFEPEVVIEDALQRVRDRVDRAKPDLPEDVEEPEVREISFSDFPILIVNLAGPQDEEVLKGLAEDLQEKVKRVPGVLDARISGGMTREIKVAVDPRRLSSYGLSLNDVIGAIGNENVNIPGGEVDAGGSNFLLRVPGELDSIQEIEAVAIKRVGDRPVFIRDVARVIDGYAERSTYARMDGQSSVSLAVTKRAGASIIDIADQVKIDASEDARTWPEGVGYRVLADQSKMIRDMVTELENNIITALLLVVGVLLFFMGPRASVFVAISIPLSMLTAFIAIQAFGMTLNMIVLFSLILALGMLVDNAIVIVENVYRHVEEGEDVFTASIKGTREVAMAVAASTATTVAAFFPLVFWTGIMGQFMGFLPKTVIIVLVSSLVVAVIVLPVLTSRLLKERPPSRQNSVQDKVEGGIMGRYRSVLDLAIEHRYASMALGVASLVGTVVLYAFLNHGTEFFPDTEPDRATISVRAPDGTDLEATDRIVRRVEGALTRLDNVDVYVAETGVGGGGNPMEGAQAQSNAARITVDFLPHPNDAGPDDTVRVESTELTIERIREAVALIPGAEIEVSKEEMGPPVGAPIAVEVSGEDFHEVGELAAMVRRRIATVPGTTDLSDDYRVGRPEMRLRINRGAAKRVGASTGGVANTVRTAVAGTKASTLRDGTDEHDITVQLDPRFRDNLQDVLGLRIPGRLDTSPDTFQVPLSAVADYELAGGSGAIRHVDQDLVVTISGDVAEGFNENEVRSGVIALLDELESEGAVPEGYDLRLGGANDEQRDAQAFLGRAFLIAVALILVVLVAQFNNFRMPVIIISSVVLSLVGVLWGLILTGTPFGVIMTGLGVISLAGVVVNNAIVLLDYVEQLRNQGMERREALLQAGVTRFRPVMLTAITTILGLVPMALGISIDFRNFRLLFGGSSAQFWGPMAVAVIFGLAFATVLTLVMVPTMYSLLDDFGAWLGRILPGQRMKRAGAAAGGLLLVALLPPPAQAQQAPAEGAPAGLVTLEEAWRAAGVENLDLALAREQRIQAETLRGKVLSGLLPKLSARGSYTINEEEISFDPASDFGDFSDASTQSAEAQADLLDGLADTFEALHPGDPTAAAIAAGYREAAEEARSAIEDSDGVSMDPVVIQQKTAWAGSLTAVQPLLYPQTIPSLRGAGRRLDAARAQERRAEQMTRAGVTRAYYGLATARERVALAEQAVRSAESHLELANRQIDAGLQPPRARIQARLTLSRARRDLAAAQEAVTTASLAFERATGIAGRVELQLPEPPAIPATVGQAAAELNRPDLSAAEGQAEAARFFLRAKRLEWLPTVDARFTYSYTENQGFQDDPTLWMFVIGADWTIFGGGLRLAQGKELASQARAAGIQAEQLRRDASDEIQRAWQQLQRAQQALEATETEQQLAEENLRLAEASAKAGSTTWLEVEDARMAVVAARLAHLSERMNRDLAAVDLRVAMGDY